MDLFGVVMVLTTPAVIYNGVVPEAKTEIKETLSASVWLTPSGEGERREERPQKQKHQSQSTEQVLVKIRSWHYSVLISE